MIDEVGVITSDLTVRTVRVDDGLVTVRVWYTGAEETYLLTNSPVSVPDSRLAAYHGAVLAGIETGGGATAPRTACRLARTILHRANRVLTTPRPIPSQGRREGSLLPS